MAKQNKLEKALEFFNNRPDLKICITSFGLGHVIDQGLRSDLYQAGKV